MKKKYSIFALLFIFIHFGCENETTTSDPIDEKVGELLSQMTLDEKIGQMFQASDCFYSSEEELI